jgi:class 3 adenylate cyclase
VTLLFTDLKGSTVMYERLGDLNAYALVRKHFALLGAIVQEHSGAIVKTIGDAVMAVFSRPTDAVSAALHILEKIERYNSEHGDPSNHSQDRRALRPIDRRDPQREPGLFWADRERGR